MNLLLRNAAAFTFALALAGLSNAEAASTSLVTVSATATPAYTDLGAAPVWMSVVSPQPVQIIIADTIPTAGAVGNPLSGYLGPQVVPAADGSSHVWAAAQPNSSATIFYSPAPAASGGTGGAPTSPANGVTNSVNITSSGTSVQIAAARTGAIGIGRVSITVKSPAAAPGILYIGFGAAGTCPSVATLTGTSTGGGIDLDPGAAMTINNSGQICGAYAASSGYVGYLETY